MHFKANDGKYKTDLFKEIADEYNILLEEKEKRLKEIEEKKLRTEALLKRYEEIIFLQEESQEDIQKEFNNAIYEVHNNTNLTEEDKEERIKELTNYYNRRFRDSIWINTQLEKAEELSNENSVYNNYDSALREIAYKKIPSLIVIYID